MKDVRHQYRILSKQNDRLKVKIAAAVEATGITVDETTHADLVAVFFFFSIKVYAKCKGYIQ